MVKISLSTTLNESFTGELIAPDNLTLEVSGTDMSCSTT